jgi:hypothetical protein
LESVAQPSPLVPVLESPSPHDPFRIPPEAPALPPQSQHPQRLSAFDSFTRLLIVKSIL